MKRLLLALMVGLVAAAVWAADNDPAPAADRVGFPKGYQEKFEVLRVVNRKEEKKVVTVYGNTQAASVSRKDQLPYPYGSVIVMETSAAQKDAGGNPLVDAEGKFKKGEVLGLHVMRREKGFGEAYGPNRSGDWEFVEYKADGSYITPPQKSAACASCHVKAGRDKDFVYQARLGASAGK